MRGPLVVDTSVFIDHLRDHTPATELLAGALGAGRPLVSSDLCRLEILAGMRRREAKRTESLLSVVSWWPVDAPILDAAENLARRHGPAHRGIGAVDYVLAATVGVVGGELATMNVTHFPMFRGLRAPY